MSVTEDQPTHETWPRVINDDGTVRLEQTSPPNSYLRVLRNSDDSEVVSTPCVTIEPKDEMIRLLLGAWQKARREDPTTTLLRDLVTAIERCLPAISSAATIAHVHDMDHSGPTFGKELDAARAYLGRTPEEKAP